MFLQLYRGRASDPQALRERFDLWMTELAPGADGFLGATAGVTSDGTFVGTARFDSEEAARRNSDRPEQGEWWSETEKLLEDPEFIDCPEVDVFHGGGSDDAGFVQIMIGRTSDERRLRELGQEMEDFSHLRPDMVGGVDAFVGDGRFVSVNYFTSEAEAREGESKKLPEDFAKVFEQFQELMKDVEFLDLPDPWLYSPPHQKEVGA